MIKEFLVIRSSISSTLLKKTLLQGFAIAFIGSCILLFAGSYLPVELLHKWGWVLFLIALGLITLGLLPYRRLSRLQMRPHELILLDSNHIAFSYKGKKLLTIPLQSIAKMNYISQPKMYGIALWLKSVPSKPILIHQTPKEVENIRKLSQHMGNADLFFPYFNQRAYKELIDWQSEEE